MFAMKSAVGNIAWDIEDLSRGFQMSNWAEQKPTAELVVEAQMIAGDGVVRILSNIISIASWR